MYPSMMETVETDAQGRMSKARSHSFSGSEANSFFYNSEGTAFSDLSSLSGMDTRADSRSFGLLDFDRDGWLDVALVNANAPQFNLYRNKLQSLVEGPRNFIAVRFQGGNTSGVANKTWSNRDGIGAAIELVADGVRISREHRGGDGFAAQNSSTILIGIGEAAAAEDLVVRWPSGTRQEVPTARAGSLLTFNESAGTAEVSAYSGNVTLPPPTYSRSVFNIPGVLDSTAKIRVVTTFETWCDSCKGELPHFKRLRNLFEQTDVELFGLPSDPEETIPDMKQFVADHHPDYVIIGALAPSDRIAVRNFFESELKAFVLPSTVILNRRNEVLGIYRGVPSVSEIRRHLARE